MMKAYLLCSIFGLLLSTSITHGYGCLEYGMAYETYPGKCQCMSGYHFEINSIGYNYCIRDKTCSEVYGYGSITNINGTCSCMSGYSFGKDIIGNKSCIDDDRLCSNEFGYSAKSNGNGYCGCKLGYMMGKNASGEKQCISGYSYCTNLYGLNGSFNYASNSCECDYGYTLKADNTGNNVCVKKENSVYFGVIDLGEHKQDAVIYDISGGQYYHISYNMGCNLIDKYIGKRIVVNLGTDFYLDNWDKIILQDDNETCDITDRKQVDKAYKVNCSDIINGYLDNGKCFCNTGYSFDINNYFCTKPDTAKIFQPPVLIKKMPPNVTIKKVIPKKKPIPKKTKKK